MSHFGNIGHHLIVAIIDHIPNGWVMFNGDMTNDPCISTSNVIPTKVLSRQRFIGVKDVCVEGWLH